MIRQWTILRMIESAANVTVKSLVGELGVKERTIRRDLAALQEAGFPLYPHETDAGPYHWRLLTPLGKLNDSAFSLAELCAFYANRERLAAAGASPIDADLESAMRKVAKALNPRMKRYLDDLGRVLECKPEPEPRAKGDKAHAAFVETLAQAAVEHRRVEMDYHSFHSRKVKKYVIEPHRLTFTNGGLYLYAFVPAYSQMRTFALQRVRKLKPLEERFTPGEVPEQPYGNSMGPYSGGRAELVEIEFLSSVAPYIEERVWHASQQIVRRDDGAVVLSLQIAVDPALRCWVLGFGHQARVLKPTGLARDILEELEEAREQYVPPIPFDREPLPDRTGLMFLPFSPPPPSEPSRPSRREASSKPRRTPRPGTT
jgi:predicted DNA-binding transcriptional regulator YafY